MKLKGFIIPNSIINLSNIGFWPQDTKKATEQNLKPLVSSEIVKKIVPGENSIYFNSIESFSLLSDEISYDYDFWKNEGALDKINPEMCVIIGDFGMGSDSPIILDYSDNINMPKVKRLIWLENGNYWEKLADNIDDFLFKLQIKINCT
jgi:hypothetical protein